MNSIRRAWVAGRLINLAHRIDPSLPTSKPLPGGGWQVWRGEVPLASISLEQIADTRPVVGSAEEVLARVSALVDSSWPIPREAMGAFVIPQPMFDSAQRNALRAALAGEAS